METTARELIELAYYLGSGLMRFFLHALIGIGAVAGVSLIFAVDEAIKQHKNHQNS